MEDPEVIEAFVTGGAKRAFGPNLHIENDCLFLDGWWQAAYRISPAVFALRNEETPEATSALDDIAAAFAAAGFGNVMTDHPLVPAITFAEIALPPVSWTMWSTDAEAADSAIRARLGKDEFLENGALEISDPDIGTELGGARRLAGLPASVILTVGLDDSTVESLAKTLDDCRFESRPFGGIQPEVCGALIPTLVVIDATQRTGREFVMELRAAACGRFLPVVAVIDTDTPPPGADVAVQPGSDPSTWAEPIRNLLP